MARGRHRYLENAEEYAEHEKLLAEYLSLLCEVPGCVPRLHLEEVHLVLAQLEKQGYKLIKENEF